MREIKFRYIFKDKEDKYHILTESLDEIECFPDIPSNISKGWKLIARDEWTGLKDKNGKEIYEGDIIIGALVNNKPCHVVYRPPTYMLSYPYYNDPTMKMVKPLPDKAHREVIGNIYENPELLEVKQ